MTCNLANMDDLSSRRFVVVVHILFLFLSFGYAEVTQFGECRNYDCSEPLGLGETTAKYTANAEDKISFESGQRVKIFSKYAGRKEDLLGVEINGRRGYVPKSLVRETKTYKTGELIPAESKFGGSSSTSGSVKKSKSPEEVNHKPSSVSEHASSPTRREKPHNTRSQREFSADEDIQVEDDAENNVNAGDEEDESFDYESLDEEEEEDDEGVNDDSGSEVSSSPINEDDESSSVHSESGNSEDDESSNVHSESRNNKDDQRSDVKNAGEPEDENSLPAGTSDDMVHSNHDATEGQDADISLDLGKSVAPAQSTQNNLQTPNDDIAGNANVQYSKEQTKPSDQPSNSVSSMEDTDMSDISPTSVNEVSYSTKYEHPSSTKANTDLHPSLSNGVSNESDLATQAEDKWLKDLKVDLESALAEVTEALPTTVEKVIKSLSEESLEKYEHKVQQTSSSSLQEKYKEESDIVKNEIDATWALLQERGFNASDMAADSTFGPESSMESSNKNSVGSENLKIPDRFHPQNSLHAKLPRQPPLVHGFKDGLKNSEHTVEKQRIERVGVQTGELQPEHPSDKKNANTWGGEPPGHELPNHEMVPKGGDIKEKQSAIDGAEEAAVIATAASSDAYGQHFHTSDKHPGIHSDDVVVNSHENNLHTSFNSAEHVYPHVDQSKMDISGHDSFHPNVDTSEKSEKSETDLTEVKPMDSESTMLNTKDHNSEASVQSEVYAGAQTLDHQSSTTESSFTTRHLNSEMESDLKEEDGQYEKQDVLYDASSFNLSETSDNIIQALRSFTETVILWLPEPFQLYLVDLHTKGVPPKVTVFTAVVAVPTVLLFITIIYIKQNSKEKRILVKLSDAEQKLFSATTERDVLKESIGTLKNELGTVKSELEQERKSVFIFKKQLEKSESLNKSSNSELKVQLKDLENQMEMKTASVNALQTALEQCKETNGLLQRKLQEEENAVSSLSVHLQEFEEEVRTLQKEKEDFIQNEAGYKEKIVELDQSCNQLLQEAEVWNSRVNELTQRLQNETSCHEELEDSVQSKDSEIQSLQNIVQNLQVIQELKDSEDADDNVIEEKMKEMLDSSAVQVKLKKAEDERDVIFKSFESERDRVMELEVELLEAKSEIDKLKTNYNHALQDKTEAQTKLEVLSNYFKDKEMQLQKELGVQEAVRQQKEEDASSAVRRINLIEEENASYKYQVATLKQEIEETERNYKSQVALQEKKAHENWLAARAAERKLEDLKQETAQLRQRLTLLEREQENWLNSSRDEIVRPVPKRPGGPNGEIGIQDVNRSKDSSGSLPLPHELIPPLRPPVLPLDRPLPPMHMPMMEPHGFPPPPPMDPYFDFRPPLPFPPQPWHARGPHPDPLLHPLDRRTPSNYERGRLTPPPPRRHQSPTVSDREIGRRSASPKDVSSRGSHTSSPPHPLPHFHDIPPPPPPGPYDFRHPPPPPINSRYPLPPPPRRDFLNQGQSLARADSRGSDMITSTPRGVHQLPAAQDRRQHPQPSSRV